MCAFVVKLSWKVVLQTQEHHQHMFEQRNNNGIPQVEIMIYSDFCHDMRQRRENDAHWFRLVIVTHDFGRVRSFSVSES